MDTIELDAQRGDPRAGAFARFEFEQVGAIVGGNRTQLVELGVIAGCNHTTIADLNGRLRIDRCAEQAFHA